MSNKLNAEICTPARKENKKERAKGGIITATRKGLRED